MSDTNLLLLAGGAVLESVCQSHQWCRSTSVAVAAVDHGKTSQPRGWSAQGKLQSDEGRRSEASDQHRVERSVVFPGIRSTPRATMVPPPKHWSA